MRNFSRCEICQGPDEAWPCNCHQVVCAGCLPSHSHQSIFGDATLAKEWEESDRLGDPDEAQEWADFDPDC